MISRSIYKRGGFRKFIQGTVKKQTRILLAMISDQIPEPTKENTIQPQTHALMDLRDDMLAHELLTENRKVIKGFFNLVLCIIDWDLFWRERCIYAILKIKEMPFDICPDHRHPRFNWWLETPKDHPEIVMEEDLKWLRHETKHYIMDSKMEMAKRVKRIENYILGVKL